tara:strand:- start:1586 stop:2503 length:918 start_codon:yes stop_codon:yes gene_type:complete
MLQQTTVKTVIPYYEKFLKKWPTIQSFFDAKESEILKMWEGLGYYQRAKNLFLGKEFLKKKKIAINSSELRKLPGVGEYTSSSISAILTDEDCAVVDSNIKRIISRAFEISHETKLYELKVKTIAQKLTPKKRNGEYCQSLMDLSNLICKTRNPNCLCCPILKFCKGRNRKYNRPMTKKTNKIKYGIAFFINHENKFLITYSKKKLLHGLYNLPTTNFKEVTDNNKNEILHELLVKWNIENKLDINSNFDLYVDHQFSHFRLKLFIVNIKLNNKISLINCQWVNKKEFTRLPISKLMMKIGDKVL